MSRAVSPGIVIVGGGPAGLATARAYRAAGGAARVTMLAAEPHAPYRRPPLTKEFLRGESTRAELPIESDAWYDDHGIELRRGTAAATLDRGRRVVVTDAGEELPYAACVLATGSEPVRPPLPGAEHPEVLVVRTIEHSEALARRAVPGARAVVVGTGFIGCEAAASLALRGARVTLVGEEAVPQGARLGEAAGRHLARWLAELGVELVLGAGVEGIDCPGGDGAPQRVRLGGEGRDADLVLLATGVRPRAALATAAGLRVDGCRVPVTSDLRSSDPDVLAAGDLALAHNPTAGRPLAVEHWGEALNHGEVAGRTLAGIPARWYAVPGFWSTIGRRTLKQAAWGDGFDEIRTVEHGGGGFAHWYGRDGVTVGVLTHERDDDYARGRDLVARGAPLP